MVGNHRNSHSRSDSIFQRLMRGPGSVAVLIMLLPNPAIYVSEIHVNETRNVNETHVDWFGACQHDHIPVRST